MLKGKGILAPIQKNLLISLSQVTDVSSFYLTGGTALAEFFLGHRRSYDLDLFSAEKDLIIPFSRSVEQHITQAGYAIKVIRRFESFVEFEVAKEGESIRLQFACDSPFRFGEPQPSELGVSINNYKDLSVDKFLTFFGRWKHRDAIDLFFILKNESVNNLMRLATEKDPGFDPYWFCAALDEVKKFPDDISQWPVEMLVKIDIKELKDSFANLSMKIMDKIKGNGK